MPSTTSAVTETSEGHVVWSFNFRRHGFGWVAWCIINPFAYRPKRGYDALRSTRPARTWQTRWSSATASAFPPASLPATRKSRTTRPCDQSPPEASAIKLQTLPKVWDGHSLQSRLSNGARDSGFRARALLPPGVDEPGLLCKRCFDPDYEENQGDYTFFQSSSPSRENKKMPGY